ncbi:MAG: hypothetical protein ABSB19_13700 [Methylomonas sp.]|jgi:hypothetical protein
MSDISEIERVLTQFAEEIALCIENTDWEKLSTLLKSRQGYLENILAPSHSELHRESLHRLVNNVLENDRFALVKIQEHQNKLIELHALMDHGMRAIKAYGGR